MKVYLLFVSTFIDMQYEVLAVFDSEETAEKFARTEEEKHSYFEYQIKGYDVKDRV